MNGAAAHLVMELEEKLVELEGLQGKQRPQVQRRRQTFGDTENRFNHWIQNNTASNLLLEDSE